MFLELNKDFVHFLCHFGLHQDIAKLISALAIFLSLVVIGSVVFFILKKIIRSFINKAIRKTTFLWSEMLLKERFFDYTAVLIPILFLQRIITQFFNDGGKLHGFFTALFAIALIISFAMIINAFLKAATDILLQKESTKDKPVKSYMQIIAVIVWSIAAILIISTFIGKSPAGLLAGIGAFSAVLLLIFQDLILGFVYSIQISANDLIRNGDWITMESLKVDGNVEEINLVTVKIRNFDMTISTIPVKQLVNGSFQNWRHIQDLGIRRIKRSLNFDINSVKICTPEMLAKFKEIGILKSFVEQKEQEIALHNAEIKGNTSLIPNGRHLTNLGMVRAYIHFYLKNHPLISKKKNATLLVRQLPPNEYGLPIEIYCFTTTSEWLAYEAIQADIFDHIYTVLPYFEIQAYQRDGNKGMK